jgi:hypothetical protein
MTDDAIDAAIADLVDAAFVAAHARHWPAIARMLVTTDHATPAELARVEADLWRDYGVWKQALLAQLPQFRAVDNIH